MSLLPSDPGFDFRAAWYEGEVEGKTLLDAIDALRAQLEAAEADRNEWKEAAETYNASRQQAVERAEAAEAECARLRADADRFRFIAAQPTDEWMSDSGDSFRTLAEAVDASMAARTKEQQA